MLSIYSSIQRQHISSVPFTRSRSHAEQFRNFYSAISLCSSSFYSAAAAYFFESFFWSFFHFTFCLCAGTNAKRCSGIHQELRFSGRLNSTLSWLHNYVLWTAKSTLTYIYFEWCIAAAKNKVKSIKYYMLHSIIIICSHNRHQAQPKKSSQKKNSKKALFRNDSNENFSNKERQKNAQHELSAQCVHTIDSCAHTTAAQYRIFCF